MFFFSYLTRIPRHVDSHANVRSTTHRPGLWPFDRSQPFFSTALNTARTGSISAFQLDQQFGSFGFGSGLSHDFAPVYRLALAFGHACRTIR